MSKLVIVESVSKAKTIQKYLGKEYTVQASMGHLRDLPARKLSINTRKNFEPTYEPIPGKDEIIKKLEAAAKHSDGVLLASDPDREGEAIAWHLCSILHLDEKEANRITFHEITRKAVEEAVRQPRTIDLDLVDAQQARRVLDRIVGYKLSPFLWRKIRRGLSAGRVQSVVTRLVVDREREIRAFVPEEYWTVGAMLQKGRTRAFEARYVGVGGEKAELHNEAEAMAVKAAVENAEFTVLSVKTGEKRRQPPAPFTTSTMQQDASRRLGMKSKRTMAVAQELYEGIELAGRGSTGLITYMRTDSVRLSDEAVSAVRDYIRDHYDNRYLPAKAKVYKAKASAQDAHEAIRPTDVNLTPDSIKNDLSKDQYRLYKLIWERFVACQMTAAIYLATQVDIGAGEHRFRASGQTVKFAGFTALYEEKTDNAEKTPSLPALEEGDLLKLVELIPAQHFTEPPARYNEASLIKTMEELGIGRPSTYAPTISTILDRDYVESEGKALKATPLGEAVTDLMLERFPDIVNVKFTAEMEEKLDEIGAGHAQWQGVIGDFYEDFSGELKKAEEELKQTRIQVQFEESDEVCPVCGKRMLVKYGRFGKFLSCPDYPNCKGTMPILDDTGGKCPKCGGRVVRRYSKKHRAFYLCEFNHKGSEKPCDFITWDAPIQEPCPRCGKNLFRHIFRGERDVRCLNEGCEYKREDSESGGKTHD